ncbi:hypothetical protein [Paenibacillus whitsoniae]|uniref:Membrane protein NfeD2 N-terminal transmembrane domain-containing protein n=1 Tax=Paenibacillus whitsoniae TaxID=2496558 RepID=A0A3S0AFN5_9BACL|nr:hypothetical protein [Paenibacillus whitsoniae]RTE11813.1 hypothetical protein EJQ19_00040 [Paenibacillus whitsoniae]
MITFFLVCFIAGLLLTVLITLFGVDSLDFGTDMHAAHGHGGHSGFNLPTLLAGITVFGGVGYLLAAFGPWSLILVIVVAAAAGVGVGWLFFLLYVKVLYKHDDTMLESEFDLSGQLGEITVPMAGSGIGEMVYVLHGTKRSISVRSEHGEPIAKGAKVMVVQMKDGVATVALWQE